MNAIIIDIAASSEFAEKRLRYHILMKQPKFFVLHVPRLFGVFRPHDKLHNFLKYYDILVKNLNKPSQFLFIVV